MTRNRESSYVWVTWLPPLMAGSKVCQWGSWFKTHYQDYTKAPSDFQMTNYLMQHTQLLNQLIKIRTDKGDKIKRENQNYFNVKRTSGLTIGGKPDLVAMNSNGIFTVYDAKTGQPNDAHVIQVMLYMMFLPYAQIEYKKKEINGSLVYSDLQESPIPASAIDADFQKHVTYFLDILSDSTAPQKCPSFNECKFCDIAKIECPERIEYNTPMTIEGNEPEIPF